MNITSNKAFCSSREKINPVDFINLSNDLIKCAESNISTYKYTDKSYRYHFHFINSRNIAVTVILSKYNNITVRGKIVNKLSDLFNTLESIKD